MCEYLDTRLLRSVLSRAFSSLCKMRHITNLPVQAVLECLNRSTTSNPFKGAEKVVGRVSLLVPSGVASQDADCATFMALAQVR